MPLRVALDGYAMEADVSPKAAASFLFVADLAGTFIVRDGRGAPLLEVTVAP